MGILQERDSIVGRFAARKLKERYEALESGTAPSSTDFLDRFIQAGIKDPELMTAQEILSLTLVNIFAGGDTTAIALSAIFYFLLKNPSTLEKLMAELHESPPNRDDGIMSYSEARNLPYLKAVIQEGLRMFPGIGNPLERVVPPQGLEVCGHFLPGGTIVGTSAWPLHSKESIFGANPREFRPERWIEASESQIGLMNSAMFAFGMGARSCVGQNISLLEIYKVIPTILWKYKVCNQVAHEISSRNLLKMKFSLLLQILQLSGRHRTGGLYIRKISLLHLSIEFRQYDCIQTLTENKRRWLNRLNN